MKTPIAACRAASLLLPMLAALATVGCAGMRSEPSGVAIGEGRQQACQRACASIGLGALPERCEACDCDQLAGSPAVCTTTLRRPVP